MIPSSYLHLMLQHRLPVSPLRDINYEYYDTDMMITLSPLFSPSPLGKPSSLLPNAIAEGPPALVMSNVLLIYCDST